MTGPSSMAMHIWAAKLSRFLHMGGKGIPANGGRMKLTASALIHFKTKDSEAINGINSPDPYGVLEHQAQQ